MKKVLLLTMLITGLGGTGYLVNTAYASDEEYERHDDGYEMHENYDHSYERDNKEYENYDHKYERDNKEYENYDHKYEEHESNGYEYRNTYQEKYIGFSNLPEKAQIYLSTKYKGISVKKVERKTYGYEVKLYNGTEIKFDTNGNIIRIENEYRRSYNNTNTNLENQKLETSRQNLVQEKKQYKYLNTSVKKKLDDIIQKKLFDRIKNLSIDKQILALDTIISKVDALVEKIKSQASLTTNDYIKLEVLEYLKDKVLAYKATLQDPTTDVINSLFGN